MLPIAVIVANRNNGRFLAQCLDSIIGQSRRPAEIVVVDDASVDNSLAVLDPYVRDGAVKLIRNESRQGVSAARHLAVHHSQSQYLTTLDADDYYEGKDKLAAELETLRAGEARGRIAFSDVLRVDEQGNPVALVSRSRRVHEGDLSFRIPHLSGFIPRDYLVSREDYEAVGGYNASLSLYEDWELKIRLSRRCTWHFTGRVGTAYRSNQSGLSRAPLQEHVSAMRRIFWMHCKAHHPAAKLAAFARFFFYHSLYLGRPAL